MHVGAVRFGRVWSHRCGSRVCRVLAPATCEPFIASVLWFFPSGLVLLLLALLAGVTWKIRFCSGLQRADNRDR